MKLLFIISFLLITLSSCSSWETIIYLQCPNQPTIEVKDVIRIDNRTIHVFYLDGTNTILDNTSCYYIRKLK
jgi:hypothetical protein